MSASSVITEGFGAPGDVNLVITEGFSQAAAAPGAVVVFFRGVSTADGASQHKGISRPTVQLTAAGGGNYNVAVTHQVSGNLNPGMISAESYLIDGELP